MPSSKIFYNLILKYTPEGDARRPFLIRYELDDETYLKYTSTGDLSNFRGKMQRHFIDKVGIKIPRSSSLGGGFDDGGIGGELPGVNSDPCPTQRTPGNGESGTNDGPPPEQAGSGCKLVEKRTEYYTRVCDRNGKNCGPRTYQYTIVSIAVECDESSSAGRVNSGSVVICEQETEEIPVLPIEPTKPCPGDPLNRMEIAEQKGEWSSGTQGGMFGCTRNGNGCSEGGSFLTNKKFHGGVDLKNDLGTPVFAMYHGYAVPYEQCNDLSQSKGAGNYVSVESTINGEKVYHKYFHLQYEGRASGWIEIGDVIGYQGLSGNLGDAVNKGKTDYHLHVKIQVYNSSGELNAIDPRGHFQTLIDDNGNSSDNCN